VAAICSGDVARGEGSDVRGFEHFPQLLDLVDGAFHVHSVSISNIRVVVVKFRALKRCSIRRLFAALKRRSSTVLLAAFAPSIQDQKVKGSGQECPLHTC
jgi:hypothetical protein